MSYDVGLYGTAECTCDCGHGHMGRRQLFSENHTSNTSRIWKEAGVDLRDFHGRPASDLVEPLRAAIDAIQTEGERFKQYEPENGWGDINSTLRFLCKIRGACERWPDAKVHVWA